MTTLSQKDSQQIPSVRNNHVPIATIINHAFGSHDASGRKTTPPLMSVDSESSLPKNVALSTTNTPHRPLRNRSSPPSLPLSPRQPPTHLGFPHSNSQKPVPAPQPHHSVSDEAADRTCARKPLQRLFRPYPKPTLHLHPYPRLCLRNPYYTIKSTFDMSTNPTLRRLHKPTFWHRHNKLRHRITSTNIPRWIPHRSCKL